METQTQSFKAVPVPGRYPGKWILAFRRNSLEALQRMYQAGGDIQWVSLGPRPLYLVSHPDLIRELLIEKADRFIKARALQLSRFLLGEGLLTSEGEAHDQQRKLILPAFQHSKIRRYADVMVEETARMRDSWTNSRRVDIDEAMNHLALKIVARSIFGVRVDSDVTRISSALDEAMEMFKRTTNPFAELLNRLPTPGTLRLKRARAVLDETIYQIIRERREKGTGDGDLLSMLIEARNEEGSGMTDTQVRDEAMTIFLAGHETTANALTWTWYLLSEHPEVAHRFYAEVDSVLPEREATFDDLSQLTYTRQVLSEAMRLYPPAWAISREPIEPVEIGGVRIPAGCTVVASQFIMHRDPRFWKNPLAFDPDRFAPSQPKPDKFVYFPFSIGKRGCIGEQFAWTEGILVLATMARYWKMIRAGARHPEMYPGITLRTRDPLPMTVFARR